MEVKSKPCKSGLLCTYGLKCNFFHTEAEIDYFRNNQKNTENGQVECIYKDKCTKGIFCKFKHSKEGKDNFLNQLDKDNYPSKTQCQHKKNCKYGIKCTFKHSEEEIKYFQNQQITSNPTSPDPSQNIEKQQDIKINKDKKNNNDDVKNQKKEAVNKLEMVGQNEIEKNQQEEEEIPTSKSEESNNNNNNNNNNQKKKINKKKDDANVDKQKKDEGNNQKQDEIKMDDKIGDLVKKEKINKKYIKNNQDEVVKEKKKEDINKKKEDNKKKDMDDQNKKIENKLKKEENQKKNQKVNKYKKQFRQREPKFIYSKDRSNYESLQILLNQNENKNKNYCHGFDLFGKCDEANCNQNHEFKPSFECSTAKAGKCCQQQLPNCVNKNYDCNKKSNIKNCHQYTLEGICQKDKCACIHKEILKKCPENNCHVCRERRQEIQQKTKKIQEHLQNMFSFNTKKLQEMLQITNECIQQQREINQLQQTCDLMFIVDCTQSMDQWISFVKDKIQDIVRSVHLAFPSFTFRYSFIGYRDFGDKKVENFSFSNDLQQFQNHVSKIKASGGGDIPEDMISGLKDGLDQKFESNVKTAFMIFDAPSHGKKYHDENIKDDHEPKETIEQYIKQYAQKDIYMTLMMLGSNKKYIAQKTFDAIINEYTYNQKEKYIYSLKTDQKPDDLIQNFISKTIQKSIRHSKLNSKISQNLIDNPVLQDLEMNQEKNIKCFNQYIRNFDFAIQWNNPFIIDEESSFNYFIELIQNLDDGSMRRAYKARDNTLDKDMVVKFDLKITNDAKKNIQEMKEQQRSQIVSAYIVNKFRDLVVPYVKNLESLPYYIGTSVAKYADNEIYCYIETYLEQFDKFSNNEDYQKEAKTENEQLLECLPHFSYIFTEGYLMVTDLQGNGTVLTDPCIHTNDTYNRNYGSTNLGQQGIAQFFINHKCNDFCKKLKLKLPQDYSQIEEKIDYQKQMEKESNDKLDNIKQISIIESYQKKNLFCTLCEDYVPKDVSATTNLKDFVDDYCRECNSKLKQKKQHEFCCMCGIKFDSQEFWLKRKKGYKNGKCKDCNNYNYLKNILEFYQLNSKDFELNFKILNEDENQENVMEEEELNKDNSDDEK
ncbi:hypothetical protein ABPG74_005711 [Tetrahymena malaccensis]